MADIVTREKRSQMMSGIKAKDTKPELIIRKGLHRSGFRYKLHASRLPGKPDLVFPKYNAVLFINGCFWHMHDCHLFKMPSSRKEFWEKKLNRNVEVDMRSLKALKQIGMRICLVWECALKGKTRMDIDQVLEMLGNWLRSDKPFIEIRGN